LAFDVWAGEASSRQRDVPQIQRRAVVNGRDARGPRLEDHRVGADPDLNVFDGILAGIMDLQTLHDRDIVLLQREVHTRVIIAFEL